MKKRHIIPFQLYDEDLDIYDEYGYWDRLRLRELARKRRIDEINSYVASPYFVFFVLSTIKELLNELKEYIQSLYVQSKHIFYMKYPQGEEVFKLAIDIFKCTIKGIKLMICEREGKPDVSESLRLVYQGKALADDQLVIHYKPLHGRIIHILFAVRGD
jgi:hypothetical protein